MEHAEKLVKGHLRVGTSFVLGRPGRLVAVQLGVAADAGPARGPALRASVQRVALRRAAKIVKGRRG